MRSNCILFALALWLRRVRRGREGYVSFRLSRLAKYAPHALYFEMRPSGSWRVVSYKPPAGAPEIKLPPPLFAGAVRWGDKP